MPSASTPLLHALFWLAASVWLGGYVAIAVVMYAARQSLEAPASVAFFRALGRAYLPVGGAALALACLTGTALLWDRPVTGLTYGLAAVAASIVIVLAVAVAQARRMTRLRRALISQPGDAQLSGTVRRVGRAAVVLRALLGLLSVIAVVLAASSLRG
ncbi:MAG: hypothetical protein WDA03_05140 [Trueperaceae bacterium]